ncbi:hypothetical protein HDU99_000840 [Rhizoclosmatium hyalinum]|nr:hypothetical protein HDU99_000840 [Rhizoclosmatium hyalinum]
MVLNTPGNTVTYFQVTVTVPPIPARPSPGTQATYFLWPGIQPGFAENNLNYQPIGNGVLQPALILGPSCITPASLTDPYSTWIAAPIYVNLDKQPTGSICNSGPTFPVSPGDSIRITQQLLAQTWLLSIASLTTGASSTYSISLLNQTQGRAELDVELWYNAVQTFEVVFSDVLVKVAQPDNGFCFQGGAKVKKFRANETCVGDVLSADGTECSIQKCVFASATGSKTTSISDTVGSNVATVTSVVDQLANPGGAFAANGSGKNANTSSDAKTLFGVWWFALLMYILIA